MQTFFAAEKTSQKSFHCILMILMYIVIKLKFAVISFPLTFYTLNNIRNKYRNEIRACKAYTHYTIKPVEKKQPSKKFFYIK